MLSALLFSSTQINLIIAIAIIFAVLFVGNSVLLALLYYKRKKSKLCTEELQRRREQLLEELAQLRNFTPQEANEEESEEIEEIDDIEDETEEDVDDAFDQNGEGEEIADSASGEASKEILAVRDMSPVMRKRFGFVGAEFERKRYYVRYVYGFEAKLRISTDEVKSFYSEIMDEACRYGAMKVRRSFRHERVFAGKKTVAMLVFRGKTLCVALALDPKVYAETKYRGKDVADIRRFAATPLLIRVSSDRKLKYVKQLIAQIAEAEGIERANENYNGEYHNYNLDSKTGRELIDDELIKVTILGEAPDLEGEFDDAEEFDDEIAAGDGGKFRLKVVKVRDMSDLMRRNFGLVGKAFDDRSYYVRYSYGFEAKLRSSDEGVKNRYSKFIEEVGRYKKLSLSNGFRQQRLYCGRKTVGLLLFKGKTLCVALALNPQKYENTKYSGIDVSEIKRFEKTPMLVKITSDRRLNCAQYLLNVLAEEYMLEMRPPVSTEHSLEELTDDGYYAQGLLKITVIGEVPDGGETK